MMRYASNGRHRKGPGGRISVATRSGGRIWSGGPREDAEYYLNSAADNIARATMDLHRLEDFFPRTISTRIIRAVEALEHEIADRLEEVRGER